MDYREILDFAPFICVVLVFFWQNNVFVKPEQLERKHREILRDISKNYVELNAYREFQNHVLKELETVSSGIDELKELLIKGV